MVIIVVCSLRGFMKGFLNCLYSLIIWVCISLAAYLFSNKLMSCFVHKWFTFPKVLYWIIFISSILVLWLLGRLTRLAFPLAIQRIPYPLINRLLGLILGFLQSVFILWIVIRKLNSYHLIQRQYLWKNSVLILWFVKNPNLLLKTCLASSAKIIFVIKKLMKI